MDERSQAYPLLIALMLSAVAAFTAGWLLARGHGQELEPGLGFWVYALLCGVSAAAWSVPWARAAGSTARGKRGPSTGNARRAG
jgi:hypothetical protein